MKQRLSIQVIIFIAVKVLLNTMVRMVYPYQTRLTAGLGVSPETFSRAISLRYAVSIFGPFLASLADRRGRKFGMLLGVALYILGVGLVAFHPNFTTFSLALILALLGNLVFIPSMQAYLGDRVPYERRGRVLALTELGWSLSFILGVPLVGWLISLGDWWTPFPVLAGLGLLAFAVLSFILPRDKRADGEQPPIWRNLYLVFTYPPALVGLLLGLTVSMANEVVNLAYGRWIVDEFSLPLLGLSATAVVIGFSDLTGELLVAGFTDSLGKVRAVTLGLILNCLAVLALPLFGSSVAGAFLGLALFYLTFEFSLVSTIGVMTEVMPNLRATFMAGFVASTAVGRALGALVSPGLYGYGQGAAWTSGILAVAIAAVAINLLALASLNFIHARLGLR